MPKVRTASQRKFANYIVLVWNGKEQALAFPFDVKHADVLEYIQEESPNVRVVSAGLYCDAPGAFWSGGQSDSLNFKSRPEDRQLLQALFHSPERRLWDLTIMAEEAAAVASPPEPVD